MKILNLASVGIVLGMMRNKQLDPFEKYKEVIDKFQKNLPLTIGDIESAKKKLGKHFKDEYKKNIEDIEKAVVMENKSVVLDLLKKEKPLLRSNNQDKFEKEEFLTRFEDFYHNFKEIASHEIDQYNRDKLYVDAFRKVSNLYVTGAGLLRSLENRQSTFRNELDILKFSNYFLFLTGKFLENRLEPVLCPTSFLLELVERSRAVISEDKSDLSIKGKEAKAIFFQRLVKVHFAVLLKSVMETKTDLSNFTQKRLYLLTAKSRLSKYPHLFTKADSENLRMAINKYLEGENLIFKNIKDKTLEAIKKNNYKAELGEIILDLKEAIEDFDDLKYLEASILSLEGLVSIVNEIEQSEFVEKMQVVLDKIYDEIVINFFALLK